MARCDKTWFICDMCGEQSETFGKKWVSVLASNVEDIPRNVFKAAGLMYYGEPVPMKHFMFCPKCVKKLRKIIKKRPCE